MIVRDGHFRPEAVRRVAERVRELATGYEPPSFSHVPGPGRGDLSLRDRPPDRLPGPVLVGGKGPFEGSALLWAVGLQAARRQRGLLSAAG